MSDDLRRERILGINFVNASAQETSRAAAVTAALVVAPSGTCFDRFLRDANYRRAILSADIVLPDSGLMVLLWRLLRRRRLQRVSGLAYLKQLLEEPAIDLFGNVLWVLPNERSREKLIAWRWQTDRAISPNECYIAPMYGSQVQDDKLLALCQRQRPRHVIIGLGAGAQEKLGCYLREHLSQLPAIHCIGGALGFITGDQVAIPVWADRIYLGWLFRLLSQPRVFIPRLWRARVLPWLILRYGEHLPPLIS